MLSNKTVNRLFKNKILRKNLPHIQKKERKDLSMSMSIPITLSYDNIYASLSEKKRHLALIEKLHTIRQLIVNEPRNEFAILKEFLGKIGIEGKDYYQSNLLLKLSMFICKDKAIEMAINPNWSMKENMIKIIERYAMGNDIQNGIQLQQQQEERKSIGERGSWYISPLCSNRSKYNRRKCIKTKSSKLPPVIKFINDSISMKGFNDEEAIQKEFKGEVNGQGKGQGQVQRKSHSIKILEKQFHDGVESYVNQSLDNNKKYLFNILNRDNTQFKKDTLKGRQGKAIATAIAPAQEENNQSNDNHSISCFNNNNNEKASVFITHSLVKKKHSVGYSDKDNLTNLNSKRVLKDIQSRLEPNPSMNSCNNKQKVFCQYFT